MTATAFPSRRSLRLLAGAALLSLFACGPASIPVAPRVDGSPCARAETQRARVPELLAKGKLDRALRVLDAAGGLCPQDRPRAWGAEVEALAEIGRYADARALASTIERDPAASAAAREGARRAAVISAERDRVFPATDAAKAPMRHDYREAQMAENKGDHALARDLYLKAWSEWHPNGQALYGAGHNALEVGDAAQAQRLFDRAIVELEATTGARVAVEIPSGLHAVRAVAWSPNGKTMAVADEREIVLLDVVTGRERERLHGHTGIVRSLVFSPDGALLASTGDGATIRLWDVATHGPPQLLECRAGVNTVAFASDGRSLAAGTDDGVQLWSLGQSFAPRRSPEHDGAVTALAFSEDNQRVTSIARDGTIRALGVDGGRPRAFLSSPAATLGAFSRDGKRFAAGGQLGLEVWDLATGTLTATMYKASPKSAVVEALSIAFSPDGRLLAMGMSDGTARLADPATGKVVRTIDGQDGLVRCVAFSPDGSLLASTSTSETVRLWDVRTGEARPVLGRGLGSPLRSFIFSPDGLSIAFVADDPIVRLLGPQGTPHFLRGHAGQALSIAFSGDGSRLASGGADNTVRLWDARTGAPLQQLSGHTRPVTSVAFAPGGALVSLAAGESVRAWDTAGRPTGTFEAVGTPRAIAISPDGQVLALGEDNGATRLLAMSSGAELAELEGHSGAVRALAFSRDGKLLASGGGDEAIHLLSLGESGESKVARKIHNHPGGAVALAFSPDSRQLASGYNSNAVRLWSVGDGDETARFLGRGAAVLALAFSPNGKVLASSGSSSASDGRIDLWSLPTGRSLGGIGAIRDRDAFYVTAPTGHLALHGDLRDVPICRVGALSYPFDLCEERFAVPDLLTKLFADDRTYLDP